MLSLLKRTKFVNEQLKNVHDELIMKKGNPMPTFELLSESDIIQQKSMLKKRYDIMHHAMTQLEKDFPWHYKEAMRAKPREDLIFPKALRAPVEE